MNYGQDSKEYRSGAQVIGAETEMQERLERAKRGLPIDDEYPRGESPVRALYDAWQASKHPEAASIPPGADEAENAPIPLESQGFDPRKAKEPEPEAEPFRVEPMSADWMLEVWYLYRTAGALASAKMVTASNGAGGSDEALAATLYVEDTPGFRREIVLFAQQRRGEPDMWSKWYGNWPDNRRLAEVIYESFRAALAQSLRIAPFRILTTPIWTPDHLEQADAANERDLTERNREWHRRRREELTKSAT